MDLTKFKSRKLWMAVVGVLVVVVLGFFDLPQEKATEISQLVVAIVSAYLLGQGYADAQPGSIQAKPGRLPSKDEESPF